MKPYLKSIACLLSFAVISAGSLRADEKKDNVDTAIPERPTPESPNMQRAPEGFVLIPAGNFQMGDPFAEGFDKELPQKANS